MADIWKNSYTKELLTPKQLQRNMIDTEKPKTCVVVVVVVVLLAFTSGVVDVEWRRHTRFRGMFFPQRTGLSSVQNATCQSVISDCFCCVL